MPENVYPSLDEPTPPIDPNGDRWSVESMIGARVLLGAGLISLLAGAVFFVKLSNDHHWIPPQVRVLCGIAAGLALLLGGAWRLSKERTLIAEGLTGLGASVLYLSLWGAVGPLHVLGDFRLAFAAMVAVTAALALVAFARRSQNVALAGLFGGALTPALLVAGPFDRGVLAVYLAILCGVMLTLAVRCGYRWVEAGSFAAAVMYAPMFAPSPGAGDAAWSSSQSVLVASVLFAEFAAALFFAARRDGDAGIARIGLLAAEVLAYASVLELELGWDAHTLALADAALAAVLLVAVATRVPAAMRAAYAWLGIGVLTRAVEAWGGGHALTATIAIEGAGLVYTGLRSGRSWMVSGGLALVTGGVAGALTHLLGDTETRAVFNNRTFAVGAVVLALLAVLRELRAHAAALLPWQRDVRHAVLAAASALGLFALTADAVTATAAGGVWTAATHTTISVVWSIAATLLIVLGFRFDTALARWLGIGLFAATIAKVFAIDLTGLGVVERVVSALVLGAVLVVVAGLYQVIILRGRRAS